MEIDKTNKIVLFGAEYELNNWKKAFRKHDLSIMFADLSSLNDVGYIYNEGSPSLFVSGESNAVWNPIAGIWRIGAVKPTWQFTPTLEILSGIGDDEFPMINSAKTHLLCSRRLPMFSKLVQNTDLPLVSLHACVTARYLIESGFQPEFPLVLKIGNFEGGLMKWKIDNKGQWSDFFDSFRAFDQPIIIEEFVDFHTEYRSLFVGDDIYVIKRKEISGWKAQHAKKSEVIEPTDQIIEMTKQAKEAVGLDIGALDFVEGENGYTVFEVNDAPDLDHLRLGIEDNLWTKAAQLLTDKIRD